MSTNWTRKSFILIEEINFFNSENSQSLQCHRVPITRGFQGAIGQGARKYNIDSLSQNRLDQMIFYGPFQHGLLYDSVTVGIN